MIIGYFPAFLNGQGLPNTNILLFDLVKASEGFSLGNPQFLTAWNRDGYNNQPAWVGDEKLLLTVGQRSDTTQTEIWELDLAARTLLQVTESVESEFSPTPMTDGRHFSSVLIEKDGAETQRLWEFPLDRSAATVIITPGQ